MIIYSCIENGDLYKIKVKGHANYDVHGSDIVCASVSTAVILSVNLIEKFEKGCNIKHLKSVDGDFELEVIKDSVVNTIIDNLNDTMNELSLQYPKNIKIKN